MRTTTRTTTFKLQDCDARGEKQKWISLYVVTVTAHPNIHSMKYAIHLQRELICGKTEGSYATVVQYSSGNFM